MRTSYSPLFSHSISSQTTNHIIFNLISTVKFFFKISYLYVRYVRGNPEYGFNNFQNNNDGTISDLATGLMWSENDSNEGLNWQEALAWVQTKNEMNYLGHNDWRLPNIKELHSIVDYTRSPASTSSAAINTDYFTCSTITNEANQQDYPYFWSGTVLVDGPSREGCYIPFGRAMAYMDGIWQDVHGAGSQKSDIMIGNPASYPQGHGPQGDAVRVYNYVRCVRNIDPISNQDENISKPRTFNIYPNPFNRLCKIAIDGTRNTPVKVSIYNIKGQLIKTLYQGFNSQDGSVLQWDGRNEQSQKKQQESIGSVWMQEIPLPRARLY